MPNGFPSYRPNHFPGEKPPTWFHPASPTTKPVKPSKANKDVDDASFMSTSTFASTVSLLKDNVKSKLHSSHKKSSSQVSEKQPSATRYTETVNGEHKTRTLSPPEKEEQSRALKNFILMKDQDERVNDEISR